MVIASGAGDSERARLTFQISINLTIFVVLPVIGLLVAIISLTPVSRSLNLSQMDASSVTAIVACSGATLWFQTLRGLMIAALYATGSYGLGYYIQGGMKLCELLALAIVVTLFSGSQVAAGIVIAGIACVEVVIIGNYAIRAAPWARLALGVFDRQWIKAQAKPAIGFIVSNFATQGLGTQAPRIVLGAFLGGSAVAVYAIYATAMRFVDQLLLMLVMPLEVEIAHSAGRGNVNMIYKLVVLGTHVSWAIFACVSAGLLLLGPLVFRIWTGNRVEFEYALMSLFMALSIANLLGRVSLHALISTNRLYGPSFVMLGCAAFTIALGVLLTRTMGIYGMVLAGIGGELLNSVVALAAISRWLNLPFRGMLEDYFDFRASMIDLRSRTRQVFYRMRQAP
jgi:O-antigen/teichoic acid export membrane protein